IGQISAVSDDRRGIVVNGVRVRLEQAPSGFQIGSRVRVSGLWRGRDVVASSVTPADTTVDVVSGDVSRQGTVTRIGGVAVRGGGASGLARRSFATAIGRFDLQRGRFIARSIERGRFTGAAGPLEQLAVEGYLEPDSRAPGFRVSGLGHSFARNIDLSRFEGRRVLFQGPYTGLFEARSGTVLPDNPMQRRRILRTLKR
ncbi:MAG: hypothetical protein AAFY03_14440, partial [Pseudomonadota bacterium]